MSPLHHHATIGSTQTEAIRLARSGAPVGTTVVADRQTAGRGRLDHGWASPLGGLYVSRVVPWPSRPALLTLSVAVELVARLRRPKSPMLSLRWPNDLVLPTDGRKLGGILADRVEAADGSRAVVGVGINVRIDRAELPATLAPTVADLAEFLGRELAPAGMLPTVLEAIASAPGRLDRPSGPREVVRVAGERLEGIGRRVEIDGRPAGVVLGLGQEGELRTEQDGTVRTHFAGTLRYATPVPATDPPTQR